MVCRSNDYIRNPCNQFFFQACYLQTVCQVLLSYGSILSSSLTAVVRYVFVRTSLYPDIQYMLKRDSFVLHSVIIQHSILLVNLGALYIHLVLPGASRPAFPVYKACVDPWGFSTTDLWTFVPFSQICFHLSNFLNIFCSISLAKYLDKTTRRSTALNPLDKKIERKKNLYSAHVGALTLWSCIFCYGIFSIVFVIPVMDNASKENNQCLETF